MTYRADECGAEEGAVPGSAGAAPSRVFGPAPPRAQPRTRRTATASYSVSGVGATSKRAFGR